MRNRQSPKIAPKSYYWNELITKSFAYCVQHAKYSITYNVGVVYYLDFVSARNGFDFILCIIISHDGRFIVMAFL